MKRLKAMSVSCNCCGKIKIKTLDPTISRTCIACSAMTRQAQVRFIKKNGIISVKKGLGKSGAVTTGHTRVNKARADAMFQKFNLQDALKANGFTRVASEKGQWYHKEIGTRLYVIGTVSERVYHGTIELRNSKSKELLLQDRAQIFREKVRSFTDWIPVDDAVLMDGILMDFSERE